MPEVATLPIVNRHGDDWVELKVVQNHDPSQHDPEREWLTAGTSSDATAARRSRSLPRVKARSPVSNPSE